MLVVLDTNVFVSGATTRESIPQAIVDAWRQKSFSLLMSPDLQSEIERVFGYEKVRKRLSDADSFVERLFLSFKDEANWHEPQVVDSDHVVRDPKDRIVLALAREGNADYIVSGDKDLLILGAYAETSIVTPAQFIQVLMQRSTPTA